MADGTTKPIKDIRIGDRVMATDPESGKTEPQTVTALHIHLDANLTNLTVVGLGGMKGTLETTGHHKIWSEARQAWVPADDLNVGERLLSVRGVPVVVATESYVGAKVMYDLTVSTIHTYYVLAGNTPVLVHNCPPGGDGSQAAAKRGRAEDLPRGPAAKGDHTVFERNSDGVATRYQTWIKNDRAPSGWQKGPRFRGAGGTHSGMEPPLYYPKGSGKALSGG